MLDTPYVEMAIISTKGEPLPYDRSKEEGLDDESIIALRDEYKKYVLEQRKLGKFNTKTDKGNMGAVKWVLPAGRSYNIAFDFASMYIGVYITDINHTLHLLIDIEMPQRDRTTERVQKSKDFEIVRRTISAMFKSSSIHSVFYEEVPNIPGRRRSNDALRVAHGVLESWFATYPFDTVREENFHKILPQTWKSQIIDKNKGVYVKRNGEDVRRFNDKLSLAEDLADKHPELKTYLKYRALKHIDSFDAAGIYHGWRATSLSETGARQISTVSKYTGNVIVWHKFIPEDKFTDHDFIWSGFETMRYNHKPVHMHWTDGNHPFKNYVNALGKNSFIVTRITDPVMSCAVRMLCGFPMDKGEVMTFVCRRRDVLQSDIKKLCATLPYEELFT